jgi:hypothetical protein
MDQTGVQHLSGTHFLISATGFGTRCRCCKLLWSAGTQLHMLLTGPLKVQTAAPGFLSKSQGRFRMAISCLLLSTCCNERMAVSARQVRAYTLQKSAMIDGRATSR